MRKILWLLIAGALMAVALGLFLYEEHVDPPSANETGSLLPGPIIRKPVIYLYPEQDLFVSVKLILKGELTRSIPAYNDGWNVFVSNDGRIDSRYDYIYYEVMLNKIDLPDEGWVVPYEELEAWFDVFLPKLGLNDKEKTQFLDYWLGELVHSPYYEIKILSDDFLDENMDLLVYPVPDTHIRLNFHFRPLNTSIYIREPVLEDIDRNGFTLVEWGGILAN
jgi:hypothetical protein